MPPGLHQIGKAECARAEGLAWCRHGDQNKGHQKIRWALEVVRGYSNKPLEVECLMSMAESCALSAQGLLHMEQCLETARECCDVVVESKCLQTLAALQTHLGNTHASNKCWQDCLNLKRELGDDAAVKKCLRCLCASHAQAGDYSRVLDYAAQLRDYGHVHADADAEAQAHLIMGKAYMNLNNLSGAEHSLKAALHICKDPAHMLQVRHFFPSTPTAGPYTLRLHPTPYILHPKRARTLPTSPRPTSFRLQLNPNPEPVAPDSGPYTPDPLPVVIKREFRTENRTIFMRFSPPHPCTC